MRIIRFLTADGREHLGIPTGSDNAEGLRGGLYEGLEPDGTQLRVDTLLTPVVPPNIF